MALSAATPVSGIFLRSPRFLARSVAIRARDLALALAVIWSSRSFAAVVVGAWFFVLADECRRQFSVSIATHDLPIKKLEIAVRSNEHLRMAKL
jgi:hypothetical protein